MSWNYYEQLQIVPYSLPYYIIAFTLYINYIIADLTCVCMYCTLYYITYQSNYSTIYVQIMSWRLWTGTELSTTYLVVSCGCLFYEQAMSCLLHYIPSSLLWLSVGRMLSILQTPELPHRCESSTGPEQNG